MRQKCSLILSDGSRFEGDLIGAPLKSTGEMVFTTGMVGYSEAITDPSYFGQILTFTYPLIGNYGIPILPTRIEDAELSTPRGFESARVHASGVIVTIDSPETFHWNSFQSLDQWLKVNGVPGIAGLDTRHIVHLVRHHHGLAGRIEPEKPEGVRDLGGEFRAAVEMGKYFDPGESNVVEQVSGKARRVIGKGKTRIGLLDCGVKWNIIRQLVALDCEVEVLPWNANLDAVDCQAWLLSNGPGNPERTGDLIARVRRLLDGQRPILGICLGHQILALAAGAKTYKMEFGHRSHNQPVYQVGTRRGYITSQNHGFVVDDRTLPADWEPWFLNANDKTIEGIRHRGKPFRSLQFHPEAAGGPRDTSWVLEEFVSEVSR